ncbi:hypothetical protein Pdw03_3879 [Penicillium digitatum]|uniref:Uncharacterized protein n=1 Tax=Penicillium digitatum TaxID=36651 RepID=A0A7T6XH60_PENDI|nr:hypothetical protein Pdw03_3879 [Penicillium digitatum]
MLSATMIPQGLSRDARGVQSMILRLINQTHVSHSRNFGEQDSPWKVLNNLQHDGGQIFSMTILAVQVLPRGDFRRFRTPGIEQSVIRLIFQPPVSGIRVRSDG